MTLTDQELMEVIERVPLVSIDLIVRDAEGRILLGLRKNEPAKGKWFVPGGRIRKDETRDAAFRRISSAELGVQYERAQSRLLRDYEHVYKTNFMEQPGVGTHYVVLAYEIDSCRLPLLEDLPTGKGKEDQHSEWQWFTRTEADRTDNIHENVLPYFACSPCESSDDNATSLAQYAFLNARRDCFTALLWQTPVLSLAAQAFLFTIILGDEVKRGAQILAAGLALATAVASMQLMIKHRYGEKHHAKMLEKFETKRGWELFNKRLIPEWTWWCPIIWLKRLPSFYVWLLMLFCFAVGALLVICKPGWFTS